MSMSIVGPAMAHLDTDPARAAEAEGLGLSPAQLDGLALSVEQRRQLLEAEIAAFIARKQDDLRQFQQELLDQLRDNGAMQPNNDDDDADNAPHASRSSSVSSTATTISTPLSPAAAAAAAAITSPSTPTTPTTPDDKARKKHGRVHKREKELYGLVTPVFLPLLDARSTSPPNKPARDAPSDRPRTSPAMVDVAAREPPQKLRRSSLKKPTLRHATATKSRRKRVSLIIDDRIVLPADTVHEPPLTSPSSETTSATTSTASLDDLIDPRLTNDDPVHIEHHEHPEHHEHHEHHEAVHHSLPFSTTHHATSPTKPINPPVPAPTDAYPRPVLDSSPTQMHFEDVAPTIFPPSHNATLDADLSSLPSEENFSTYVGGLTGSGADDVNQAGSYGYPSSLGASYLESYMASRPLSVRRVAADRAGLDAQEKRELLAEQARAQELRVRREEEREKEEEREVGFGVFDTEDAAAGILPMKDAHVDEEDDFMGSMEDF